jgi:hypothetical protein
MRTLKTLFFLIIALIPFTLTTAQGISAWDVILYYEQGQPGAMNGTLVSLTPNGTTATYTVPATLYAAAEANARADVVVSPDRQYAAIGFWTGGAQQPLPSVAILNLQTGSCCTYVNAPVVDMDGYDLIGFSADSSQLALSYVGFNDRDTYSLSSGLLVVDVATGQPTASLPVEQAVAQQALPQGTAYLQPGQWIAEGIQFYPSCYACGGTAQSPWYFWNPQTNTVVESANSYFSIFGQTLAATNELLLNVYNTAYPAGEQMGMFPPTNVIEYYSQGVPPAPEDAAAQQASAPVVYFNPANLDLSQAHWVSDGNAFLIQANASTPQSVVVYRDGTQTTVPLTVNERFLTGTPDGFLAQRIDGWIVYYQDLGGVWNAIDLDQFPAEVQVVDSPALGASVTQPFTLLPSSAAQGGVEQPGLAPQQQQQVSCPGALEARLAPGGVGRVGLGGFPNRVRADASTSAAILTVMQPGTAFNVISGPICDTTSTIVWWQVEVNGLVGWSAESQDGSYFLEPQG